MEHLHDALRHNAKRFLDCALESEADHFLDRFREARAADGQQLVVRNGFQPERCLMTGLGAIPLRMPKFRSRSDVTIPFRSTLVPAYRRRMSESAEAAHAVALYLRGILGRNVGDALQAVVGSGAPIILPGLARRFAAAWVRICDELSERLLHDYAWSGMRALTLSTQGSPAGIVTAPCAMVFIGRGVRGRGELLQVRACDGDSSRTWSQSIGAMERRGVAWPRIIEIGGAAQSFRDAWKAAAPCNAELKPVNLQTTPARDGAGSRVVRAADETAHGCSGCGLGRCVVGRGGVRNSPDVGGGVVHQI